MRVFAVDPGYDRVGLAIAEDHNLIFSDCIVTDRGEGHGERLVSIGKVISCVIRQYKPEHLAIESLFFNTNQKTAMKVSEARGVILYESKKVGLEIFEYTPPQIKIAVTGHGRSDKKQVAQMCKRLIKIDKQIKYDDEYDAIAIALTHIACYRD